MRIVLLSDDLANVRIAREKGIVAYTCREYVSSLTSKPELIDRLAAKESKEGGAEINEQQVTDLTRKNKTIIFPEHLKLSEIQAGIKAGKFYQGYNSFLFNRNKQATKILYLNKKAHFSRVEIII